MCPSGTLLARHPLPSLREKPPPTSASGAPDLLWLRWLSPPLDVRQLQPTSSTPQVRRLLTAGLSQKLRPLPRKSNPLLVGGSYSCFKGMSVLSLGLTWWYSRLPVPRLYPGRSQFRWSGSGIQASSSLHVSQVSQRRGHPLYLIRLSSSGGPWQSPAHTPKYLNNHHSWCYGLRPELCVNYILSSRLWLCTSVSLFIRRKARLREVGWESHCLFRSVPLSGPCDLHRQGLCWKFFFILLLAWIVVSKTYV